MQTVDEYTQGWTAAIEYDLKHDGATFDASGMTPSLVLRDKDENLITIGGTVEWADQSNSRVRFYPAENDLQQSKQPYTLHWKVTDGSSRVAFYPQGAPILLRVYKQ